MPKLTKSIADSTAATEGRDVWLWDSELKGLGLRVMPSGVKTYIFQYRNEHGQQRRVKIGRHGAIMPDQARKEAQRLAYAVSVERRDVAGERDDTRKAGSVGDLLHAYLASAHFAGLEAGTQESYRGRIVRHLIPTLGDVSAKLLTADRIRKALRDITEGKTAGDIKTGHRGKAKVRGGEGTARMALRVLRAVYSWALAEELVERNPCIGIEAGKDGRRFVRLSEVEYVNLFSALARCVTAGTVRQATADLLTVLALTGARPGELQKLGPAEVKLSARLIVLERHKTAKRTGKPRVIPLPKAACAILTRHLEALRDGQRLVFEGDGGRPIRLQREWHIVRTAAGLPAAVTPYGLRHAKATAMALAGAGAMEIQQILGHTDIATSQLYVHFSAEDLTAIADRYDGHTEVLTSARNARNVRNKR